MQIHDQGFIITLKTPQEKGRVVKIFSQTHGLMLGWLHGRKNVLQRGDMVSFIWRARLSEQLGAFTLECKKAIANHILLNALKLKLLQTLTLLLEMALPERQPYPLLFEETNRFLDILLYESQDVSLIKAYILWELTLLEELGFGLSLKVCALTGSKQNLAYVSPKTGRAASQEAAQAYRDKLFALPQFLWDSSHLPTETCLKQGLQLTGYFIEQHVLCANDKKLPISRVFFR